MRRHKGWQPPRWRSSKAHIRRSPSHIRAYSTSSQYWLLLQLLGNSTSKAKTLDRQRKNRVICFPPPRWSRGRESWSVSPQRQDRVRGRKTNIRDVCPHEGDETRDRLEGEKSVERLVTTDHPADLPQSDLRHLSAEHCHSSWFWF